MNRRRVLVTGSRTWVSAHVILDALAQVWGSGDAVLVTGACPTGADRIAEMFWRRWGGQVERHPANWDLFGRAAGFRRNAEMVATRPDVCLAFMRGGSPGTAHTVQLAEAAGIPTHIHRAPAPRTSQHDAQPDTAKQGAEQPDTERGQPHTEGTAAASVSSAATTVEGSDEQRVEPAPSPAGGDTRADERLRAVLDQVSRLHARLARAGARPPEDVMAQDAHWFAVAYDPALVREHLAQLEQQQNPPAGQVETLRMAVRMAREATDHATHTAGAEPASDAVGSRPAPPSHDLSRRSEHMNDQQIQEPGAMEVRR